MARAKTANASRGERRALLAVFARGALSYWTTVFPLVCLLIARWRRRARRIPDPMLRSLALWALAKRTNIEGSAAFAAFAPLARRSAAITAASAFQCAYNLLDIVSEQPSADPVRDGRRLHEALVYALTPGAPRLDWYEHHPQHDDGGFLDSVLDECQAAFASLPSHETIAKLAQEAAERIVAFQSLNLSEAQGDHTGLERWATQATADGTDLRWWETAAAAGSSLALHALIAAAVQPALTAGDAQRLSDAYFPWIGCLHSLLDNLIDKREDEAAGHRSLLEYYPPRRAAERMGVLAERAREAADDAPYSQSHRVMLAAMIANYLSTKGGRRPELQSVANAVMATAGPLARPTMLVFKLRRLGD